MPKGQNFLMKVREIDQDFRNSVLAAEFKPQG
jgi:hypothetical protein